MTKENAVLVKKFNLLNVMFQILPTFCTFRSILPRSALSAAIEEEVEEANTIDAYKAGERLANIFVDTMDLRKYLYVFCELQNKSTYRDLCNEICKTMETQSKLADRFVTFFQCFSFQKNNHKSIFLKILF